MKRVFLDFRWFAAYCAVGLAVASVWGPYALWGLTVGLAGAIISFISLWGLGQLLGSTTQHTGWRKFRGFFFFSLFLFKLPLLVAMIYYVHWLGPVTSRAFILGIGMVYLWAVGWAESSKD